MFKLLKKLLKMPFRLMVMPLRKVEESRRRKHCQEMFARSGYKFYEKDRKFHIEGNGLHIQGNMFPHAMTTDFAFLHQDYYFYIDEPFVMFDIGFNLGMTSLYWARDNNMKQIYSYEPFAPTRKQGEENLRNNPELSKKIELFKFGLGDSDKELEFHYNPKLTGSMSTVNDRFNESKRLRLEKIQIKKASDVLKPLFEKHSEKKFVKLDCEGSEFEILPDLDEAGLLKDIDVIIMEWHDKDPKILVNLLAKNNFNVYCMHTNPEKLGMIVAFKK